MLPQCTSFGLENSRNGMIQMTLDEYETIRLIDFEGLTQEQCADQMGVGRTTAQAIYAGARRKLAEYLVKGMALVIEGGEYRVCEHHGSGCGCPHGRSGYCRRDIPEAASGEG